MTKCKKQIFNSIGTAAMIGTLFIGGVSTAQVALDPALPNYTPVDGISGSVQSVGSDTMNNLMTLWGEGFRKLYPNVKVEIEGKGSSTAPPALISGTSNFGPMSRKIKDAESNAFEKKYGYKPIQLPTSIDMVAIYVNKDNPIANRGLSLPEVDAILSKNRNLGYPKSITIWGQLGLKGSWAQLPISLYGRNAASGTYGYVKHHALGKGDYKDSVKEQPGSAAVVQGIASDRGGLGYSGIGYKTADVKAVPLAFEQDGDFVPAEVEYAYTGEYPLARFLYLTINKKPGTPLDPFRREFIKYIFSKQGQEVVIKDGYFPLTAEVARKSLKMAGINPGF